MTGIGNLDGLVVVDKPPGCTSHDVVQRIRKAYGTRKVGHAGTLDPDATGVLLVGVGRCTRLLRFLGDTTKVYRGEVRFGSATDTLDASGVEVARCPMPALTAADVTRASAGFVGEVSQVPPMVSALKVGGKRLHELARSGEVVERQPRTVRIDGIDVEEFVPEGDTPRATLMVCCGSGTYIRSLAADLGEALGGYAHLAWLRRVAVGPFTLSDARSLTQVEDDPHGALLPLIDAMGHLPRVDVDAATARAVGHGVVFPVTALAPPGPGPFRVVGPGGRLLAVYEASRSAARPAVVVGAPE